MSVIGTVFQLPTCVPDRGVGPRPDKRSQRCTRRRTWEIEADCLCPTATPPLQHRRSLCCQFHLGGHACRL